MIRGPCERGNPKISCRVARLDSVEFTTYKEKVVLVVKLIIASTFREFIDTINQSHLYDVNVRNKRLLFRKQKKITDACQLLICECGSFILSFIDKRK